MSWGKGTGNSSQSIQANPIVEAATMNSLNAMEQMLGLGNFQEYGQDVVRNPAADAAGRTPAGGGGTPTVGPGSPGWGYADGAGGGGDPGVGTSTSGLRVEGSDPIDDHRTDPYGVGIGGSIYDASSSAGPMPGLPGTPGFFPGQTVADMDPMRGAALEHMFSRGLRGSGAEGAMNQYLQQTIQNPMANPLTSQMFGQAAGDMTEVFNEQIMPGINATFANAGRTGSGLQADALGNAAGELSDSLQGLAADMFGTASENALGRQMAAAGMVPDASALDFQNIDAMQRAGLGYEDYNQSMIDAARERYEHESTRGLQDFQRGQDALTQYIDLTGPLHGTGTTQGRNEMRNVGSKK